MAGHIFNGGDVSLLCGFAATAKNEVNPFAFLNEIHAVARANVDTHFRNTLSHRGAVPKVTESSHTDAGNNAEFGRGIFELAQPRIKLLGGQYGVHGMNVAIRLHMSSAGFVRRTGRLRPLRVVICIVPQ